MQTFKTRFMGSVLMQLFSNYHGLFQCSPETEWIQRKVVVSQPEIQEVALYVHSLNVALVAFQRNVGKYQEVTLGVRELVSKVTLPEDAPLELLIDVRYGIWAYTQLHGPGVLLLEKYQCSMDPILYDQLLVWLGVMIETDVA